MAKRVFISFAVEDSRYRDFLVGQAKNDSSPFEFVDMSVKEPWDEDWKEKCRTKIKGCDGMIALVSKNTNSASGARFEMKCANEEDVRLRGVYTNYEDKDDIIIPAELEDKLVVRWTWDNIKSFIDSL
jgi:hypothetical protein